MDNIIKLTGVTGSYIAVKQKCDGDSIVVLCRVLNVGDYTDCNGTPVHVDEKRLAALVSNYNARLESEFQKYKQSIMENKDALDSSIVAMTEGMTIEEFDLLPNQIDHNFTTVKATVGNIMGKMYLKESLGRMAIFCNIKVKGDENVKCIVNGTWRNLSAGFDMDKNVFHEISWVIVGADPNAQKVLSNPLPDMMRYHDGQINMNPIRDAMLKCEETATKLYRQMFIKERTIALCKSRKITMADRWVIEARLSEVADLTAIGNLFDILDDYIPYQTQKHQVILMTKKESDMLHETVYAASNIEIYKK